MDKLLKFLAWSVGIGAVIAIILRVAAFKVWTVPDDPALSASLAPTLSAGDVVVVMFRGTPGSGDLVRCPDPEDAQRWVVGRIVGTQGDKVKVDGGRLTLNGRRYDATESCTEGTLMVAHPTDGHPVPHTCSRVEFAGGWHYVATADTSESPREATVGAGRFFLLSDNLSFHDDSRDFGAVMADTCKDKVLFRLWGKDGFTDSERRFDLIR